MPKSKSHRRKVKVPVKEINGSCSTTIDAWKASENRNFVVVKFSIIKTLGDGELGFTLQGNQANLGDWRGTSKAVECPPGSGHHVVYVSLPKSCEVIYKWILLDCNGVVIQDKEYQRSVNLGEEDLTVQDYFAVPSNPLPHIYKPDYHPDDHVLMPVVFVTNHQVQNKSVEAVAVTGSTPELGRWRAVNARMMYEVEPGKWATILYLTKGLHFRYKFVVIDKIHNKKVRYGERREHRVHLPSADKEERDETERRRQDFHGVWTLNTQSNISIRHVEEQSMGSVASDISLGTKASLTTHLSDINEVEFDELLSNPKDVTEEQSNNILREVKEELYASPDLIDFHSDQAGSHPLITNDGYDGFFSLDNVEKEDVSPSTLPTSRQTAVTPPKVFLHPNRLCAEWICQQQRVIGDVEGDDEEHLRKINIDPRQNAGKTISPQPITESTTKTESHTNASDESNIKVEDSTLQKKWEQESLTRSRKITPTNENNKAQENTCLSNQKEQETGLISSMNGQPEICDRSEEQRTLLISTNNLEYFDDVNSSLHTSNYLSDEQNSCISLRTPTARLPCYFPPDQSSADVARKLVLKLPWILDLPAGLVTRVLHSLGILTTERQADVALHLKSYQKSKQN